MSFPMIQFKATNTHLDGAWQDLVEQKFRPLEKYIEGKSDLKCQVEFEKIVSHQKGDVHRVEVNLYAGGKLFRAEATERSFEIAIDEVKKEIERELGKNHDKRDTLVKRGGRKIKEMLRFME